MHIILTHEQADFDALASLLAAHLLHDSSIPVLPRRINRNVKAFLTLYGMEIPFVDPRDLGIERIEVVTLVDTQSLVSIKGMGKHTNVQVVDHHPVRESLPDNWNVQSIETGATTTLFVEMLREKDGTLSTIQATLLLLGIYEDTGSLTYTRTTARDLRAAAYLLEHGADLQIAGNFINLPLSQVQEELFRLLTQSAEYHKIHGFTVIIAKGDASHLDEELSSIAHKMRDFLDPDALFMLLKTGGGVQLIARSMKDNIDVADILTHFGGGGHERAAACLIRDMSIDEVHEELIQLLWSRIKPSVTVSELMSVSPQLLLPDTTVESASESMRRYGYEGYPVVEDGNVIGLLTRRAVDRALAHKLNLPAEKLMEAGNFTVNPDDSIEYLQNLMTESGWGQIPVVDPETDEIIGIVTRTDLLKTLTKKTSHTGHKNLSSLLESSLPAECLELLKIIANEAFEQRTPLYIVGGFVRDLLMSRHSLDFDLVVEGDAIKLAKGLAEKFGGRVTSHGRFGTAKWLLKDQNSDRNVRFFEVICKELGLRFIDFVSARKEFYTYPTALPTVERGSIKLDLHRRDFTINTLALRLDGLHFGELHDYWGGYKDLQDGLVRVLHSLSFVDDPTRILRAVRFEQRFNFKIEDRTLELLREATALLERLSGDRIRHELDSIFIESNSFKIMMRLEGLNLLGAVESSLICDEWFLKRLRFLSSHQPEEFWGLDKQDNGIEIQKDLSYTVWMIRLMREEITGVMSRLRIPSYLENVILEANHLWRNQSKFINASPSIIFEHLSDVPAIAVYGFFLSLNNEKIREAVRNYAVNWQYITLSTDGNDLKELGIRPGPIYRKILKRMKAGKLDGKFENEEEEKEYLEKVLDTIEDEK